MKIRNSYHRCLSAILSFAMVLSILPVNVFQSQDSIAYAAGTGAHVVGSTAGGSSLTSGAYRANWWDDQQGVRITIVDNDGNIMLNGSHQAVDILFSNPGTRVEFTSTKFQDWDVDNEICYIPIGQLQNKLISAITSGPSAELLQHLDGTLDRAWSDYPTNIETMPMPILCEGGVYIGNGDAVKAFFVDGELGGYNSGGYTVSTDKVIDIITGGESSGGSGNWQSKEI